MFWFAGWMLEDWTCEVVLYYAHEWFPKASDCEWIVPGTIMED